MESNHDVLSQVESNLAYQNTQSNTHLNWLTQAMHPFFFTFNQDEVEALGILANSIHRIERFPHITLTDRPERLMLAQVANQSSFYNTLNQLPSRNNLAYAEFNTSTQNLPDYNQRLEVLRFDYNRKSDQAIAEAKTNSTQVPEDIIKAVQDCLLASNPDFDAAQVKPLVELLWHNNEDYVRVSHPERIARMLELFSATEQQDGIYLNIEPAHSDSGEVRILFGVANPPQHNFPRQVLEVFTRLGLDIERAYILSISNGVHPFFLATFYAIPTDNIALEKHSELYTRLQRELYNTQILSISSPSYHKLLSEGVTNGTDASLVDAMISFCHTNLAHNHPEQFEPEVITIAFHNQPNITLQLLKLFHVRFSPDQLNRETEYAKQLQETDNLITHLNTGRRFLDDSRRTIFKAALSLIRHTLKTNFFVPEKHALAFRLDPAYLDDLGEAFIEDLPEERPFRITYFFGRRGCGYHIGFSDIARGGWRTLMTQGRDDYINSANTLFKENYVLAHTQHLKNKDIYEGGSKMVAILSTDQGSSAEQVKQHLYKLQFGFINAFLDLYVTENGRAKDTRVVDYYQEDEPIELGPDENMHDTMVELVAQQAVKRGYILGKGIMSSKKVGINHKEYGVTSIGVTRFAEVTMQEALGINMHHDAFSVKFTGGPNGDVAGNGMRLLLERCPDVQVKLIIDGTGALFDPEGLDHSALDKIVLQDDVEGYDVNALHVGGSMIYRQQTRKEEMRTLYRKVTMTEQGLQEEWLSTDAFYQAFNSLAFTVETDLFIPAGGRPETINNSNIEQFFNAEGQASAKVIVEGANSFITPEARLELQKRGVVIMRDASANKCGVISSSYEIIANLMLSDEEFLSQKPRYVSDVVAILNHLAESEARLILKRHADAGGTVPYTQISNQLSREINDYYARMFTYFQSRPELLEDPLYRDAMLHHLPKMIAEDEEYRERVIRLPAKVRYAILASKVASQMVYAGDDTQAFADMVEAQLRRLS